MVLIPIVRTLHYTALPTSLKLGRLVLLLSFMFLVVVLLLLKKEVVGFMLGRVFVVVATSTVVTSTGVAASIVAVTTIATEVLFVVMVMVVFSVIECDHRRSLALFAEVETALEPCL